MKFRRRETFEAVRLTQAMIDSGELPDNVSIETGHDGHPYVALRLSKNSGLIIEPDYWILTGNDGTRSAETDEAFREKFEPVPNDGERDFTPDECRGNSVTVSAGELAAWEHDGNEF